jgi:hypothetical protein
MTMVYSEQVKSNGRQPLSPSEANRHGLRKLNKYGLVLECGSCGTSWSNLPGPDGDLPRGFWRCPRGCNW